MQFFPTPFLTGANLLLAWLVYMLLARWAGGRASATIWTALGWVGVLLLLDRVVEFGILAA